MSASASEDKARSAAKKVYACLQNLHFLHRFKLEDLEQLLTALRRRKVAAGTAIYRQGEQADAFFIVAAGSVGIWQKKNFRQHKVSTVGQDGFFGDNALIGKGPRAASAMAETDCELYVLYKDDFERILMANPEVAAKISAHRATTLASLQ